MNQIVTKGIVLSRTNYGEADRILTILTPDHGRIRVMAKGVRKLKSKLAGGIELLSISDITFIKGKGDIGTLISTRLSRHFGHIVSDLSRTMFAYEALKRVNKSVEDNAGEEYFKLLAATMEGLDNLELSQTVVEFWFEAQLLKLAGHSPNLKTDTSGKALESGQTYGFDLDNMAFVHRPNAEYSANHIKLLRLALGLESPIGFKQIKDADNLIPASLQLVKMMLS